MGKTGIAFVLICLSLISSIISGCVSPSPYRAGNGGAPPTTATLTLAEGPCRSNEDWHQRADQTGAWIDGVLVNQTLSETEIRSVLSSHTLPAAYDIRISPPHYIGYYIEVPESRLQQVHDWISGNQTITNISFSSPMYGFIHPSVRNHHDSVSVLVPVWISSSPQMNETVTYRDLVDRGIPVNKAGVIEIDWHSRLPPADRELFLKELSGDDRVLFTYKAYLEGVLCEYPL